MNKAIAMLCVVLLLLSGVLGIPGQFNAEAKASLIADNEMSIRADAAHSRLIVDKDEEVIPSDVTYVGDFKVFHVAGLSAKKLLKKYGAPIIIYPNDKVIVILKDQIA